MASLQARHSRSCALGRPWTRPDDRSAVEACTCRPTLYVVVRRGSKLDRVRTGKNRQSAERALRKIATAVDDGVYVPQRRITFAAWSGQWLSGLERKRSTRRSYASTIARATAAFGHRQVRDVSADDVRRLLAGMRGDGLSASTRAKHLRVLSACLHAAVESGYAGRNVARALTRGERPRAVRKESAYFEQAELAAIFARLEPGVYRHLIETSLKTGTRLGELLALEWCDIDLSAGVARIHRSYTDGQVGTTKTHQARDVDLTADLVNVLGAWWGELGSPAERTLVFPGPSGHLDPKKVASELYLAMAAADVSREGRSGETRSFHSLRHTFAKTALEAGRPITWAQRQLGHGSITITVDRYGHWERAARRREADLMLGAFGV